MMPDQSNGTSSSNEDEVQSHVPTRTAKTQRTRFAPFTCAAIIVALNLAFYAMSAPVVRIFELAVCREYYFAHDPSMVDSHGFVEEKFCKVDEIQRKVAWLLTINGMLGFLCDFIATLPLSLLADIYGPRRIMLLNFGGQLASWAYVICVCYFYKTFTSTMVFFSAVFTIFGGATHLTTALIYGEAAVFTTDRTSTFSLLEGLIQASQLLGPVIGSALLTVSPFFPFYFTMPFAMASLLLVFLLPPGRRAAVSVNKAELADAVSSIEETDGLLVPEEADTADIVHQSSNSAGDEEANNTLLAKLKSAWKTSKVELRQFARIFTTLPIVRFSYAAMLVHALGKQQLHILLQYVSKRFGTTIAQAGFLFSIKAAVVIVLYTVIIPGWPRFMSRSGLHTSNIQLLRISALLLALGSLLMGLSWNVGALVPGLIIFSSGFGYPVLVRSIATTAATAEGYTVPVLYSGLAYSETMGSFLGATVVTAAFTSTISYGGAVAGIPFITCAFTYAAVAVPTFTMNLRL